jgi:hypothetical protein
VIAVTRAEIMLERSGEVFPIEELPAVIVAEPSSMIVAERMGEHILSLSARFADSTTFQYKLTPIYRDVHKVNGKAKGRAVLRDTTTTLVGFPGHFHHPVDPESFIRFSLDEIMPGDESKLIRLMKWGKQVRDFCLDNDMAVKPSAGGLASQLLRDRRFYPHARRKVPGLINSKGRDKLPGNYYDLLGERKVSHSASYLDMSGAHHHIARKVPFPDANKLHAYGCFKSEKPKVWAEHGTARLREALNCYGLLHVKLRVPHLGPNSFPPPCMSKGQGKHDVWIFTNELSMIRSLGGEVESIYAALISDTQDTGLAKYAEFAQTQLLEKAELKPWLKPVLHSPYGVLAGRPRPVEIGWRLANGGLESVYPMGGKVVPVKVVKTRYPIEPSTVNVIQRGMIEAEQRCMTLALAKELTERGGEVICIYADSLFVNMPQLPLLPAPWVLKDQVEDIQFLSATQFMSKQITRMPGVPHSRRKNFAPAGRTQALNEHGLPTRSDSGSRTFRPMASVQ